MSYSEILRGERELQLERLHVLLTVRQFFCAASLGALQTREFALLPRVVLLQLLETLNKEVTFL